MSSTTSTSGSRPATGPGPAPLPAQERAVRRAVRSTDDRMIGGVAGGLAEHLGLVPLHVRVAFIVASMLGGFDGIAHLTAGFDVKLPFEPPEARINLSKLVDMVKRARVQGDIHINPDTHQALMAEETSLSAEVGMQIGRASALVVAGFIILNTFLISVTSRRKQLGIMRAIGATRWQIAGMIFREALLMGIVGTAAGSLLGLAAAHYMNAAMGKLYMTTLPPIEPTITPFLLGLICGLGISLVAAAWPASTASFACGSSGAMQTTSKPPTRAATGASSISRASDIAPG